MPAFAFHDLREIFAKANEEKSGDRLAGLAADSETERVAAKRKLADLTLAEIVGQPLIDPDGDEVAVHEYAIQVTIDRVTGTLVDVVAQPRVLPFPECPAAAPNARWLIGLPVADLRFEVISRIRGADCCTHLNDALRALADVPALLAHIPYRV